MSPTARPATGAAPSLQDPFPLPHDPPLRRWVLQVVMWGWAQVPAGNRAATAALLYYQHEHGMATSIVPMPSSRMERMRWRRLSWSVLQVAQHRAILASIGRAARREPHPAVRLLAVNGEPGELEALTAVCADPSRLADADLARSALECVRTAVREGRYEALELLGLLRDAVTRHRAAVGHVPPMLESKLITLAAIVAREMRDPAGIPRARVGLRRIHQLVDAASAGNDREGLVWHVESGYRTSQELADLYLSLGRLAEARAAADLMRALLRRFGDPDPSYLPNGWHWNLLVTESSIHRHLARASTHPEPWRHGAAMAARHAVEMAADGDLPESWAVAAESEIIALALDRLADAAYRASKEGDRLFDEVTRRLGVLEGHNQSILDQRDRSTRSALLQARLLSWRLALIQADPAAIRTARAQVLQATRSWAAPLLPIEAETIARYIAASGHPQDQRKELAGQHDQRR